MARCSIDDVSQDLHRNDDRREPPTPAAATEPAEGGHPETIGEKKERNSDDRAERFQVGVCARIEFPGEIEWRAVESQGDGGERCHAGGEDQEDSDCGEGAG